MEELNKQWQVILNIINKDDEDLFGGLLYEDLTIEQLHAIIEASPDFWNPNNSCNGAPTNNEFLKFMENNNQFIAETQLVSPERNDYRVLIVGIKAIDNKENTNILYKFVNNTSEYPDEYGVEKGYIRAWWD